MLHVVLTTVSWSWLVGCTPDRVAESADDSADTAAPLEPPRFDVTVSEPESEVATGVVWVALLGGERRWVLGIDGKGAPVWSWPVPEDRTAAAPRPGVDGRSLLFALHDRERADDVATVERVDAEGRTVSSTATRLGHHTFVEERDGQLTWLSLEWGSWTPDGGEPWTVRADTVVSTRDRQLYSFLDDFGEVYVPCHHMVGTGADFGVPDAHDWTHANSLALDPAEPAWYVGARHLDAIVKLDADGRTLWTLGGPSPDIVADAPFSHVHFSQAWDDHVLLFDNGNHAPPPRTSEVAEYVIDADAGTATRVWSYAEPEGRFVSFLGDARRLPGGTTLIAWSVLGRLEEVDADGRVLWRAELPQEDGFPGRIAWSPTLLSP